MIQTRLCRPRTTSLSSSYPPELSRKTCPKRYHSLSLSSLKWPPSGCSASLPSSTHTHTVRWDGGVRGALCWGGCKWSRKAHLHATYKTHFSVLDRVTGEFFFLKLDLNTFVYSFHLYNHATSPPPLRSPRPPLCLTSPTFGVLWRTCRIVYTA